MLGAGPASIQAGCRHRSRPDRRNGGLAAPIAWVGLLRWVKRAVSWTALTWERG